MFSWESLPLSLINPVNLRVLTHQLLVFLSEIVVIYPGDNLIMKATILIQDITVDSLPELDIQELNQISGGYSWKEFKQDTSDFFDGLVAGFNSVR